jgi:hypothetical protein
MWSRTLFIGRGMSRVPGLAGAFLALMILSASAHAAVIAETSEPQPILLDARGRQIELRIVDQTDLRSILSSDSRYVLRVEGLAARTDPGTGFHVFLNIDADASKTPSDRGYAGTLNFFGAPDPADGASRRVVSFDVKPLLRRLYASGPPARLVASIYPAAEPAAGSQAFIRRIAIATE